MTDKPNMSDDEDDHIFDFVGSDDEEEEPRHAQYDNLVEEKDAKEDTEDNENDEVKHVIEKFITDKKAWSRWVLPSVLINLGYQYEQQRYNIENDDKILDSRPIETFVNLGVEKGKWTVNHMLCHFIELIWNLMLDDS